MRTEGLQDSRSAESSGSNGVGRKCLGRVKWLGLVCARGWYPSTSARHTRPQHELALLLPSIPILLALLRYFTPCTILFPLLYPKILYISTHTADTTNTIFQPQQRKHYPTLTQSTATCRRHAIVQRIQVLPRVCRFTRHTKLRTRRLDRAIDLALSAVNH